MRVDGSTLSTLSFLIWYLFGSCLPSGDAPAPPATETELGAAEADVGEIEEMEVAVDPAAGEGAEGEGEEEEVRVEDPPVEPVPKISVAEDVD